MLLIDAFDQKATSNDQTCLPINSLCLNSSYLLQRFTYCIFILVLSLTALNIRCQENQFKHYSVEEGLPQSQVYAMIEDSRGYLWLGTKGGGLSSFDGKHFKTYSRENGLINDQVFSIFEDSKNNLWIGTASGVSHYNGIEFTNYPISRDFSVVVSSILEDNNGTIWVATHIGLFYLKNNEWVNFSLRNNVLKSDVSCLYLDEDGSIWTGNDEGLFNIKNENIQHFTYKDGLSSNKVRCITRYEGNLLVGTYGRGLNFKKDNKWYVLGDQKEIVHHILIDKNKDIWLSTQNNGAVKISPGKNSIHVYNQDKGLSANHVRMAVQDSWGNLWFGTSGGGLNKFYHQLYRHYNLDEGLKDNKIYSTLATKDGRVFIGTGGYGLTEFIGDSVVYHDKTTDFYNLKSKALFEDVLGNIWIGTEGKGIYIYNGTTYKHFTGDDGLADNWIRGFCQDKDMNVWVATVSGITKFKPLNYTDLDFSLKNYREFNGLPDNRITTVLCDSKNKIWFGTKNGKVGYIFDDEVVEYGQTEGIKKAVVKSLTIDHFNRLWVGTEGEGLFYSSLDDQFITFNQFNKKDGLKGNNVYLLKVDQLNQIWAGAGAGIDRISFNDEGEVINVKHFGKNEGFLGGETCTNSISVSPEGEIWVGTLNGLNRHDPANRKKNHQAPKLSITDILLFYESIGESELKNNMGDWFSMNDKLTFEYSENHISFNFKGVNLQNPEEVYYQFRLTNFDRDWSPISKKNDATYSNLPAGDYTFEVKAGNEDNVWTEPIQIKFSIKIPIWQTWYFYTILGVILISIFVIWMRMRLQAEKKKTKEEREKLEMERHMVELEQKALRLQMNPHFIFNAMNTVQALIAKKDEKAARYYLAKFSKLMRKVLENSRSQMISIHDEMEALENYLNLEKISSEDSFDYEIIMDENIEPDAYGIPPLLLQPFTENAIVHGLKEIEHRGCITIRFKWKETYIECSVEDNGRGREAAKEVRHQKSSYHKSTALVLTQERLATLSNELSVKAFEIVDLENPTGTRVILRIPVIEVF